MPDTAGTGKRALHEPFLMIFMVIAEFKIHHSQWIRGHPLDVFFSLRCCNQCHWWLAFVCYRSVFPEVKWVGVKYLTSIPKQNDLLPLQNNCVPSNGMVFFLIKGGLPVRHVRITEWYEWWLSIPLSPRALSYNFLNTHPSIQVLIWWGGAPFDII